MLDSPPTFIVGCGHSGTWLLLAVLGMHSRIYAIPMETEVFFKTKKAEVETLIKQFDQQALLVDKNRWVEKTPSHINRIGDILHFCPDAKIILMVRDGRDVAHSMASMYSPGRFDMNVSMCAKRWVDDNRNGQKYWDHPNVKVVKYEDTIIDFEKTLTSVLDFMGEKYESEMKDFHTVERRWCSPEITKPETCFGKDYPQYRNWQINQPLFDGRGRYRKMSDKDLTVVTNIAGDMLFELGYVGID